MPDLIHRMPVPVVSVGNLTMGGTGKTPVVAWMARWFREQGLRVTIVSRGYRSSADGANDEAVELEQSLPDVPQVQDRDRVAAALMAIDKFAAQLILLDDGFQHRRLHRDLDVVLVDSLQPFGFDHVFPRGTLRERLRGVRRADVIALTRANYIDDPTRAKIRQRLRRYNREAKWVEIGQVATHLTSANNRQLDIDWLTNRSVAAFCGIGNPASFRSTLDSCDCQVMAFREFPDHHQYSREDIENIRGWIARQSGIDAVICTQKDLVKIDLTELDGLTLWALRIGLRIQEGQTQLTQELQSVVPQPGSGSSVTCLGSP